MGATEEALVKGNGNVCAVWKLWTICPILGPKNRMGGGEGGWVSKTPPAGQLTNGSGSVFCPPRRVRCPHCGLSGSPFRSIPYGAFESFVPTTSKSFGKCDHESSESPTTVKKRSRLFICCGFSYRSPAELILWNCGSGRGKEPAGESPPPDSDPFSDAEFEKISPRSQERNVRLETTRRRDKVLR
jgi:hypothetical protein